VLKDANGAIVGDGEGVSDGSGVRLGVDETVGVKVEVRVKVGVKVEVTLGAIVEVVEIYGDELELHAVRKTAKIKKANINLRYVLTGNGEK